MPKVESSRANRIVRELGLLGVLALACGCGGGSDANPGPAPDSEAKQAAESQARKAAYGGKTIQTKGMPAR
jgi:hypothetical protein